MSSFIINPYRYKSGAAFGELSTYYDSGGSSVNTGSVTLSNVATGDLVLAFSARVSQTSCTGITMAGSNMALQKRSDAGVDGYAVDVWSIIASSPTSSATVTASFSNSNTNLIFIAARWSGVTSATASASSCNSAGCNTKASSSTDRLAQSITTSQKSLIVATGVDWNTQRAHTAASGWTKRLGDTTGAAFFLFDRVSDAGTFGGATAFSTTSVADEYLSAMLAFSAS